MDPTEIAEGVADENESQWTGITLSVLVSIIRLTFTILADRAASVQNESCLRRMHSD